MPPGKPTPKLPNLVTELVVDAYGCHGDLSDVARLETLARRAVESVGATVATSAHHRFQPHGLTLCLILMESHLVLSTWPEHDLLVVNLFLCNAAMDTRAVWAVLEAELRPAHSVIHEVRHRIERYRRAA